MLCFLAYYLFFFFYFFFFFHHTAPSEIYTLSLHDALPILRWGACSLYSSSSIRNIPPRTCVWFWEEYSRRSEEHTSELQSRQYLVCRLLLEKKKEKD